VFVEAAKTLYRDYLMYKDKMSERNGSVASSVVSPHRMSELNIKLQNENESEVKNEKKCC
jgi:hypothetical protein